MITSPRPRVRIRDLACKFHHNFGPVSGITSLLFSWSKYLFAPPAASGGARHHWQALSSCPPFIHHFRMVDGRSGMTSCPSCTSAICGCPGYPHGVLLKWKPMHLHASTVPRLRPWRTQSHHEILVPGQVQVRKGILDKKWPCSNG
mgnify:CR=1 FL=1